ncbi:MAG TPA: type III secretion system export apparatus subunit SctT [Burkholderiaceae bacterium]
MDDVQGLASAVVGVASPLQDLLLAVSLSSLRLLAAFSLLPPMGEKFITGGLRNGLVTLIGFYIAFGTPLETVHRLDGLALAGHAAKEAAIGLMLGFVGSKVFWIAQSVGALIDAQSGFNNVQMTNPLSGQQSTPVSDLLLHVIVVVFFSLGGMLVFLGAVFDSYHVWPLLSPLPQLQRLPDLFVPDETDSLMAGVAKFAAPMLIVLLLIDLGFGLVTRSAGKLEVSTLSQPVKGAVTVLMLALLLGTLVSQVKGLLLPQGLLQHLQPHLSSPAAAAGLRVSR